MNQFPKLMEVVGLGYTLWFSWRYLLFKVAILREIWAFIFHRHDDLISVLIGLLLALLQKNRDELATKIEELKQQVLGSNDD